MQMVSKIVEVPEEIRWATYVKIGEIRNTWVIGNPN